MIYLFLNSIKFSLDLRFFSMLFDSLKRNFYTAKPVQKSFKKLTWWLMITRILYTHLVYFIALGNGRTLEGDASVRTAFQVIEDANTDVGNLRSMCSLYANKLLTVSY